MSGADAIARGLAARAAAAADRRGPQFYSGTLPAGLGWDGAHWPISFGMHVPIHGRRTGWCSIDFDGLFPGWRSRTTIYVDGGAGADANDGLSGATPVRNIVKAVQIANARPETALTVSIKAGTYYRVSSFIYPGTVFPAKDIVFVATGGRAIVTSSDNLSFTVDATNAATWTTSVSTCTRVMDMQARDALGRYTDLVQVTSAALCYLTPGSWALVSGTLYVHRADAVQPSATNTRVFRNQDVFATTGDTQYSFGFTGDTDADGFDFEGGNTASVAASWTGSTTPATPRVFAMRNCSARYAGNASGTMATVRAANHHGLVFLDRCSFGSGLNDSINIHVPGSGAGLQTYLLTVNCSAYDSGQAPYTSCNAWTMHEDAIGIDICGDYQRAKGATLHIIGSSRALLLGTAIGGAQGDRQQGGTVPAAEIKTDDSAEIWADSLALTPNGLPGYEMLANSRIHLRNMPPARAPRVVGTSGVIDSW